MSVQQQSIVLLKIANGIMSDFSVLIDHLIENKKKYKITTETMQSLDLSKPNALLNLTESFDNEKIGVLVTSALKLISIQEKFTNFTSLDDDDLIKFHDELKDVVAGFDEVLGKEKV